MRKILLCLILFLTGLIYSEDSLSYFLLQNVIDGIKANVALKHVSYPSKSELKQMGEILDEQSNFNPIDVIALIRSESRFYTDASSGEAHGICQLTPSTKKWLLSLIKEEDQNSCVQDFKLCLKLLNLIQTSYQNNGIKNPKFLYIVWAYNAGVTKVISNNWIQCPSRVYIQPKLLARTWTYYSANFRDGVFDISIDCPGYRYTLDKEFDSVKFKINPEFKKVFIDLKKHTLTFQGKVYPIGVGIPVDGKDTCSPRGEFRIIWKIWYSRGEGGAYGVGSMRLNYRFSNGKSVYIHGTPIPKERIGKNLTGGCIALENNNFEFLYHNLEIGDYIYIK